MVALQMARRPLPAFSVGGFPISLRPSYPTLRLCHDLGNEGVDVIFTSGNAYNRAVIHEARQADVYVIGFLTDQSYMAEEHVLTSVVQDVPQGYVMMVEQFFSEEGLPNGDVVLDLASDIYGLTPYGPMVPPHVVESMDEQMRRYLEGELELIRTDEAVLKDYIDGQ
jgi:transcriptional activator of comK gene